MRNRHIDLYLFQKAQMYIMPILLSLVSQTVFTASIRSYLSLLSEVYGACAVFAQNAAVCFRVCLRDVVMFTVGTWV